MLKGNELIERVNNLKDKEMNDCTYLTKSGYGDEIETSFKFPQGGYYVIDILDYYCNKYLGLDENIIVPISTPESEIKNNIIEFEGIKKELSESIAKEVKEIEAFLNEKVEILKKKAILQYTLNAQLVPLKEIQSVREFDITNNIIENKNQWIEGKQNTYSIEYTIKNEVFSFRYKITKHWSYRSDVPKVDISYNLYVNIKGKDYSIADVEVVKLESEKDTYIEKLKSRFAKYFKYEKPTIDERTIEKLIEEEDFKDYSFEELKDRLITMNYNVVKKL